MSVDMRPLYLRAQWSAAYINDLPDSSFLYIAPGGTKTGGRTDGAHRYFPYKDAAGKIDVAHLNNAIGRIPQASDLSEDVRAAVMKKAKDLSAAHPDIGSGTTAKYEGTAGSGRTRDRMPVEVMGLQTRTFPGVVLELRVGGDGRTIYGRAVPYGETIDIPSGRERFCPGAFDRQISARQLGQVKLFTSHAARLSGDVAAAVGRTVDLADRPDGAYGAWGMYETPRGEEALHLVKTGEATALSIGFKAVDGGTVRGPDGAYERRAVHLDHVVLTNEPAYPSAHVTGVRDHMTVSGYRRDLLRARQILDRVTDRL
jgi:uncharacterized protein